MVMPLSGAIPIGELSLNQRAGMRTDAVNQLAERATTVKRIVGNRKELVIRQILPNTDLGVLAAGGGAAGNRWLVDVALAAADPAARVAWINIALAQNRMLVIYGGAALSAIPAVAALFFQSGPGGATVRAIAQLEDCYAMLETAYYLTKAALWDPQETVFISIVPRIVAAADTDFHLLKGYIAEPVGEFISGPVL